MDIDPADQQRLEEIAVKFRQILDQRFEMQLRVARRTTAIIRIGMISLGVMAVSMLFLVLTLTYQMTPMIAAVQTMNAHFTNISNNMVTMRDAIQEMDGNVAHMPAMATEMAQMQQSVREMTGSMDTLAQRMRNLDGNMAGITTSVGRMTSTFAVMNQTVSGMNYDVNRMSGPMKTFNSVMPLP
jgi:hypothetical protein